MSDIESNIDININADKALSAIKQLQAQLSKFYQDMSKTSAKAAAEAAELQQKLINSVNSTGKFSASMKTVTTTTESFTNALERNKLSLGQYFSYGASQVTGFRKIFSTEFDTIDKVARERVKTLQTQYIKLGRDANGAMKAISVRPLQLDMNNLGTQVMMTAQKQQIFNELLKQGSTQLLNFGKNTQWAGRQLMVGFTIPLSIFGATAAREFMKIEEQVIKFQKVYGDFSTSADVTDKMTESIKNLGIEFTKYGVAVEKTIGLAAEAAAMGQTGTNLMAQVSEATRLAVLGGVEQSQALETTISLTNAFGVSADKLSSKINFLNAVENQTVTSIEDLTEAIPKAGPVVQQLGGNVEDLAFFLTAMKEGGINASEGANALKSGLASMINPTQQASDMLAGFGINIKGIVDSNAGDIKGTVVGLADALNKLDPLNRAQAIEQLFGKFQFARISTLFQNVADQGSQANRVLQLMSQSQEELAVISEREMKRVENSPMYKFQAAVEKFQAALAPIGQTFLEAVTPIINFGTDLLNKFNEMSEGSKQFWTILVAAVAGIGPVLLMAFGLVANGVANIIKVFTVMGGLFGKLSGQSKLLGGTTQYMSQEQLESAAIAASLNQVHQDLIQTLTVEADAANKLAAAYRNAAVAMQGVNRPMTPGMPMPGGKPKKYADGAYTVPGPKGAGDIVPAMLAPGEAVIPADRAEEYRGLIQGIVDGKIPGFEGGTAGVGLDETDMAWIDGIAGQVSDEKRRAKLKGFITDRLALVRKKQLPEVEAQFKKLVDEYAAEGILSETGMKKRFKQNDFAKNVMAQIDPRTLPSSEQSSFAHADPGRRVSAAQARTELPQLRPDSKAAAALSVAEEMQAGGYGAKVDLKSSLGYDANTALQQNMAGASGKPGANITDFAADWQARGGEKWNRSIKAGGGDTKVLAGQAQQLTDEVSKLISELPKSVTTIVDTNDDIEALVARGGVREEIVSAENLLDQAKNRLGSEIAELKSTLDRSRNKIGAMRVNTTAAGQAAYLDGAETPEERKRREALLQQAGLRSKDGQARSSSEIAVSGAGGFFDRSLAKEQGYDEQGKLDKELLQKEKAAAEERGAAAGEAYSGKLQESVKDADPYENGRSKKRNSPHPQAGKDGADDGKEYKTSFENASGGISVGPGPLPQQKPRKRGKYEPEFRYTAETAAIQERRLQNMADEAALAGPGAGAFANKMDDAVANIKAKYPKMGNMIDKSTSWLQRKLDLDGSFADQEEQKRQALLAAEDRVIQARQQEADRIAQGGAANPNFDPMAGLSQTDRDLLQQKQLADDKAMLKESKRQKRAKLAGKVFGAGMVATTALGMMSTIPGQVGETAQQITPVVGAISTFLPMLISMGPVLGSIVGVLGLAVYGIIQYNIAQDEARKKGLELAKAMGTGADAMAEFAEFAGRATATEIRTKQRETQMSPFAIQPGESTFGQSYVGSEQGKAKVKSIKSAVDIGGMETASNQFAQQMAAAVASGAFTTEEARSIAAAISNEIGNQKFMINAIATFNALVGPNGEDIAGDGIDMKVNLIEQSRANLFKPYTDKAAQAEEEIAAIQEEYDKKRADLQKTGNAAGSGYATQMAAINIEEARRVSYIQQSNDQMTQASFSAGVQAGMLKNNLDLVQQMVDANELYYQKLIDEQVALGNIGAAEDLNIQRLQSKQKLLDQNKALYEDIDRLVAENSKDKSWFGQDKNSKLWESQKQAISDKYKEQGSVQQQAALDAAEAIKNKDGVITEERQVKLLTAMETGALDPQTATNVLNMFGNSEEGMTKVMTILTEMDAESANQIFQMSSMFSTEGEQKEFLYKFENADPQGREELLNTFSFIQKMQMSDQDLQFTMEFYNDPNNDAALKKTQKQMKDLENTPDVTMGIITEMTGVSPASLAGVTSWFEGLPEEQQKVFTSVFTSIFNTVGDRGTNDAYKNWLKETGTSDSEAAFGQWAGVMAKSVTPSMVDVTSAAVEDVVDTPSGGGGGGGGRETSVLDDLLQKLRRVQMATLGLTEGWKGAREALDGLFPGGASNSPFQGIEQQMRRLGAKEDLITMIAGMDPEEFQKRKEELFTFDGAGNIIGFRDSLLSIGAALRSIKFGEFQSEQQKNINVLRDQNDAIRKLIANGFSMADAYEMVQDAAFASAVAQEQNNEIIRQATEDYKEATKQAKIFAAAQAAVSANQDVAGTTDALAFISANTGNLSNEVINEILTNQDFATLIMSPNLTQQQRDALQQWIDNIENQTEIDLSVNLQTIEGMEKIFQDGFNKAMEAFSAQEKQIELEFEVKKDPFQKTVENAQNLIADIQNRPGGMDDLQADLDRIANQEQDINKKYKQRNDALNEVKKNNERIIQQRKAELTVADAITQGDIAAAAKSIEDARAQQAQSAMQAQQEMMQRQQQAEVEALTGSMSLTREQIEQRVRDLKQEILNIEETMLEPAQYHLSLLERQEKRQKESLTVLGMSRREWETLNNRIQVAKTSSDEYKKAMESARDVVGKIVESWKEIEKPKTTVHTIITNYVNNGSAGGGNIGASSDGGGGGGGAPTTPSQTAAGDTTPAVLKNRYSQALASPFLKSSGGAGARSSLVQKYNAWIAESTPSVKPAKANLLGQYLKTLGFNSGGLVPGIGDTDKIRSMLTPGEFVITKPAVDAYGARMMKDINNGTFDSGSVYNYSINVNVDTDADANQIADVVMRKIKNIDSMRIRGNRF